MLFHGILLNSDPLRNQEKHEAHEMLNVSIFLRYETSAFRGS